MGIFNHGVINETLPDINIKIWNSPKELKTYCLKHDIELPQLGSGYAQTFIYETNRDIIIHIVIDTEVTNKNTLRAILVHEASHVVDFYLDHIGEENIGEETRAYLLQAVSFYIFENVNFNKFIKCKDK